MLNPPGAMQVAVAQKRTQNGGDWFFWIAGYSLVNTLLMYSSINIRFALGLGTTDLINRNVGILGNVGVFGLDLLSAAFYVLYGFFARKGALWAFLIGMIFFALDGLLLLPFKDWISIAFHGYALFRIFQGFQAAQELGRLRAQVVQEAGGYAPPSSDVWPPPPSA